MTAVEEKLVRTIRSLAPQWGSLTLRLEVRDGQLQDELTILDRQERIRLEEPQPRSR